MTRFPGGTRGGGKPPSNVYTVLVLVACLALGTAAGVTAWKNIQLTGKNNPFLILEEGDIGVGSR